MKAFLRSIACASVALASVAFPTMALAGSKALALKVTGSIAAAPVWQNASDAAITELQFDFTSIAGDVANADVSAPSQQAKLVNATSYPATVGLVRPKGCTIGASSIADSYVVFVFGGSDVSSDSNLSFASNAAQSLGMKFAAAGGYGKLSGTVSCANDGALTYTY